MQNKTKQNKTKQNKTKQNKTRVDRLTAGGMPMQAKIASALLLNAWSGPAEREAASEGL
jgi:hypothetical protein